jgi:hypothetical protein
MTVTVQIKTNTAAGKKLITELRRYPDLVRFVEPDKLNLTRMVLTRSEIMNQSLKDMFRLSRWF